MAHGSRDELHFMAAMIYAPLPSPFLTEEEVARLEAGLLVGHFARIPVAAPDTVDPDKD